MDDWTLKILHIVYKRTHKIFKITSKLVVYGIFTLNIYMLKFKTPIFYSRFEVSISNLMIN